MNVLHVVSKMLDIFVAQVAFYVFIYVGHLVGFFMACVIECLFAVIAFYSLPPRRSMDVSLMCSFVSSLSELPLTKTTLIWLFS